MVCVIRSECESIFLSCEKCWSFKEFFVPNPCALETYQNECSCLFIFPEKWGRGGWGTEQSWESKEFNSQAPLLNSLWMLCLSGGKGLFPSPFFHLSISPHCLLPLWVATAHEHIWEKSDLCLPLYSDPDCRFWFLIFSNKNELVLRKKKKKDQRVLLIHQFITRTVLQNTFQ